MLIKYFHSRIYTIAKPFVADLKANITTDLLHPMLLYQHCLYLTHGKFQNKIQYHFPLTEKSLLGSYLPTMEKIERRKQWVEKKP